MRTGLQILLLSFALSGILAGCAKEKTSETTPDRPLDEGVYVWQRVHSEAIKDSLRVAAEKFERINILIAEIDLSKASFRPQTTVAVAYDQLSDFAGTLVLCIRLENGSPFPSELDDLANLVASIYQAHVSKSQRRSSQVELQIDYDAPTSKLSGYENLITHLRRNLPHQIISITALPTWLSSEHFKDLTQVIDSYTLQLHSIDGKTGYGEEPKLFELDKAIRWTNQADQLPSPFRVSLPTYSHRLHYNSSQKFLGVTSEDRFDARSNTLTKELHPPVSEISEYVSYVSRQTVTNLSGLDWFRIPSQEDSMNWTWDTLDAVRTGKVSPSKAEVQIEKTSGVATLYLVNTTKLPAPYPLTIATQFHRAPRDLWDILSHYSLDPDLETIVTLTLTNPNANERIAPGTRKPIAWFATDSQP